MLGQAPSSSLRLTDRWLHEGLAEFRVGSVGMVSLMKHFSTAHRVGLCSLWVSDNEQEKNGFLTFQRILVSICDGVLRKNNVDLFFYC